MTFTKETKVETLRDDGRFPPPCMLFFGPQITKWDRASLLQMQDAILQDRIFPGLSEAMAKLPSVWDIMAAHDGGALQLPEEQYAQVQALRAFTLCEQRNMGTREVATFGADMPNIQLAPLTVARQLLEFRHFAKAGGNTQNSLHHIETSGEIAGVQGFCVGFISASAVAASRTWKDLTRNGAAAVYLAMCIGAVVDAANAQHERAQEGGFVAVSVRLKRGTRRREYENTVLAQIPGSYISCSTDESQITTMVPKLRVDDLKKALALHGHSSYVVNGLRGPFHHPTMNLSSIQTLSDFCNEHQHLRFSASEGEEHVQLQLRLTTDAQLVSAGTSVLHIYGIEAVLHGEALWFQTVASALDGSPQALSIVSFGDGRAMFSTPASGGWIPQSIARQRRLANVQRQDSHDMGQFPEEGRQAEIHQQPHHPLCNREAVKDRVANQGVDDHVNETIDKIAVIGMGCCFPGAETLEDFWHLISEGRTALRDEFPNERFDPKSLTRNPHTKFHGAFITEPAAFDHRFFGISGREARAMDPQQRLALQVAYQTLESAGYFRSPREVSCPSMKGRPGGPWNDSTSSVEGLDVGCYMGVTSVDYDQNSVSEEAGAFTSSGTLRSFIAGRISHFFGWEGPAMTIDTACSSSAVAIHLACKALQAGECSMALAGGVNLMTGPYLFQNLAAGGLTSKSGISRAFDDAADGYCRGEGVGIVMLKRLKDVVQEDDVLGVIAASVVSQSANCSPIMKPVASSQVKLFRKALSTARIRPDEVTYVEAHGTSTPIGDPIEYQAIRKTFNLAHRGARTFIGSVKDNIGHTESASGVAGLIKTLLMLREEIIPKQANFVKLSSRIEATEQDWVSIATRTKHWELPAGCMKRTAIICNYGASGSNSCFVVHGMETLDHTSLSPPTRTPLPPQVKVQVFPIILAGKSRAGLLLNVDQLAQFVSRRRAMCNEAFLRRIAFELCRRHNSDLDQRLTFVASNAEELLSKLEGALSELRGLQTESTNPQSKKCSPVVLCFGGQTGRSISLSQQVYNSCPILQNYLDHCNQECKALALPSIIPDIIDGHNTHEPLEDLVALHCRLFSLQYATAKTWMDCGLEVSAMIGHSFGQLSLLCVSGCINLSDAFRLVSTRARLLSEVPEKARGVMVSVDCDPATMGEILAHLNGDGPANECRIEIACYNGPRSFVLAGDRASIDAFKAACSGPQAHHSAPEHIKELDNGFAYHSRLMEPILSRLEKAAANFKLRSPLGDVRIELSHTNASRSWGDEPLSAADIVAHTRMPVQWDATVRRVVSCFPSATWIEAGSASSVIPMTRRVLRSTSTGLASHTLLPLNISDPARAPHDLAQITCELWKIGSRTQFWPFRAPGDGFCRENRVLFLPPYRFDSTRHWIEFKGQQTSTVPNTDTGAPKFRPNRESLIALLEPCPISHGNLVFEINTSNDLFREALKGHRVLGHPICPAPLFVELAVSCIDSANKLVYLKDAGGGNSRIPQKSAAVWQDNVIKVRELKMSHPLRLDNGERKVYLQLTMPSPENPQVWSFTVTSRLTGKNAPKEHRHASAALELWTQLHGNHENQWARKSLDVELAMLDRLGQMLPIQHVQKRAKRTVSGPRLYTAFDPICQYAEYYQGIKSLDVHGEEVVASMKLPSDDVSAALDGGPCHMLTLDNYCQVAGMHVNKILSDIKVLPREDQGPAPPSPPADITHVYVCVGIDQIIMLPRFLRQEAGNKNPAALVYCKLSLMASPNGVSSCDIFAQDTPEPNTPLCVSVAIIGAKFHRISVASFSRMLDCVPHNSSQQRPGYNEGEISSWQPDSSDVGGRQLGSPRDGRRAILAGDSTPDTPVTQVPAVNERAMLQMLSELLEVPRHEINLAMTLDDIGLDSLLVTEAISEIQKRFAVTLTATDIEKLDNVTELCQAVGEKLPQQGPVVFESRGLALTGDGSRIRTQSPEKCTATALRQSQVLVNGKASTMTPAVAPSVATIEASANIPEGSFAWSGRDQLAELIQEGTFDILSARTNLRGFCQDFEVVQTKLVAQYIAEALESLGIDLADMDPGAQVKIVPHPTEQARLMQRLYEILAEAGIIFFENNRWRRSIEPLPAGETLSPRAGATKGSKELLEAAMEKYPRYASELRLIDAMGSRLADFLVGKERAIAVLAGDAEARSSLQDVYAHAPLLQTASMLLCDYLAKLRDRVQASPKHPGPGIDGRTLRILEIGAGTGATTRYLLERLAKVQEQVSEGSIKYTFTDISPVMVAHAKKSLGQFSSVMTFATLDVEREPPPEFVGQFDIVISTNCVHATKDLTRTCANMEKMIRNGGILCLVEVMRKLPWFDLVWGLLPGWWAFDDGRKHSIADEYTWAHSLRKAGYGWVEWSKGESDESDLIRLVVAAPGSPGEPEVSQLSAALTSNETEDEPLTPMESFVFKVIDGVDLYGDVYFPSKLDGVSVGPRPIALLIHGGGHVFYSRTDIRYDQKDLLLSLGFLPISLDYRKCPEVTLRHGVMEDVVDGLYWARRVLPRLQTKRPDVRVDGSRVVCVGWSSGGNLAMSLAWTSLERCVEPPQAVLAFYCATDYEDPCWTAPNRPAGSEVGAERYQGYALTDEIWEQGVFDAPITGYKFVTNRALGWRRADPRARLVLHMNWHGTSLNVLVNGMNKHAPVRRDPPKPSAEQVQKVSPLAQIRRGNYASPTFIVHAGLDDVVTVDQVQRTYDALCANKPNLRAELRVVEDAVHAFDAYPGYDSNKAAKEAVEDGYAFLCKCIGLSWDRKRFPFHPSPVRAHRAAKRKT